jgi:predicted metal-dependent peptidase
MKAKSLDLIAKAKAELIMTQPFFASLLLPLPLIEDNSVPTMATDGESILFNSDWVESLTMKEVLFVLAHEVLHCAFLHMTRRGSRNANRWNIAADYVINETLVRESIGSMPKGGLHDSNIFAKGGGTAEGIYSILPKDTESKGAGQKGGAMDQVRDAGQNQSQAPGQVPSKAPGLDPAQKAQKEQDWKVKITQAGNAAKMRGKLTAGLARLVNDLVKTKTDWKEVLRNFVMTKAKNDFTFARPKRRFMSEDIYLPGLAGQNIGSLAIAVDCSGSVNKELLTIFAAIASQCTNKSACSTTALTKPH